MAVVWRVVALTFVVTSCIGQVPISFGEDPNKPLQRHDLCAERSSGRPVDGVCRPMQECPLAMEAYTTVGVTMVTTCGFEGVTRIVCCPKGPERVNSTSNGTGPVPLKTVDISSPILDFECGKRPPYLPDYDDFDPSDDADGYNPTPDYGPVNPMGGGGHNPRPGYGPVNPMGGGGHNPRPGYGPVNPMGGGGHNPFPNYGPVNPSRGAGGNNPFANYDPFNPLGGGGHNPFPNYGPSNPNGGGGHNPFPNYGPSNPSGGGGHNPFPDYGPSNPNGGFQGAVGAVGGVAAYPNSWPWTALMGWSLPNGTIWWRCGAALINRQWVVTAAHCFDKGEPQVIRLGEQDYLDSYGPHREDFKIRRYLLHPEYSIVSSYHDIALVELDRPVELKPEIAPVCLPWGRESLKNLTESSAFLTGWGALQHGSGLSSVLQEVLLSVFSSEVCDTSYRVLPGFGIDFPRGINEEDFVCAGDVRGGRDACSGDSGSSLAYLGSKEETYYLAGVVSKGYGCGLADFPGLYTPLHRGEYLDWIKRTAFA